MILTGDCLVKLRELEANSVDAVVTDPPYGLSFMGKKWDYDVPSAAMWSECLRVLKPGGHVLSFGGTRTYHRMVCAVEDAGFDIRDQLQWLFGSGFPKSHNLPGGIGTALKPANEPIVLARKPLSEKTVAKNVERWGVGGLNIDASRVGMQPAQTYTAPDITGDAFNSDISGRERNAGLEGMPIVECQSGMGGAMPVDDNGNERDRFKTSQHNHHPTVKPIKLMEYLIKLITPPGGIVLDPFMGSGSTGVAAVKNGFKFIGIEMNEEYCEIARRRIEAA